MAQWMQCDWIQTVPTWADATCNISPDTHDGFDEDAQKRIRDSVKRKDKAFKSARERLREVIEQAWDGPEVEAPIATEVRAIAAPYVERLESGSPRVDYAALERNKAVMRDIIAFQGAMRAEYQRRVAIEQDDEDIMILASSWN